MGIVTLPPAASLFDLAPPVMDQGSGDQGTGSCTGHATSCGAYVAAGLPWVPSPAELYRNGRELDRTPGTPLTDDGAQPSQVFRGINEFGVRPMTPLADRFSDADPSTINDESKLGDLEAESLEMFVGDYRIDSTGKERLDDICTAIAGGQPVTVAIAGGSSAFQSYSGGVLPALNAELDHYVCLLAYRTLPDGTREFGGRNSWSVGWGEEGNFWLSEAAVQELGDVVALSLRKVS